LSHGGLGPLELAAAVPPLVLWLAGRLPARRAAFSAGLSALLGVAACWGMVMLMRLR
jgi:hypothetical protein